MTWKRPNPKHAPNNLKAVSHSVHAQDAILAMDKGKANGKLGFV